jgi:peptide/nickel transport system substrate-binding protein
MDSGIVAQHGADWHTKVSAGTGPFKFVHWKRGQEVRLAAHKDYWDKAPAIDEIVMLIVPSFDTAVSMYEANALDVVDLEAIQARRVLKDPRFKDEILAVPAAQIRYMGMNQNLYAPFKDKRVREAVCLSFDREALVKGLYGGAATPLYGQITPGIADSLRSDPGQAAHGGGRIPGREGPAAGEAHVRAELQGRAGVLR